MPASYNKPWPGSEAPSGCAQARRRPDCCVRSDSALWVGLGPAPHCSPSQPRVWALQIAREPVIRSHNKSSWEPGTNLFWNVDTIVKCLKKPPAEDNALLISPTGVANKPWKLNTNWSQILCPLGLGVLVWNINISREFIFHSSSAAKEASLTGYWTWIPQLRVRYEI